MCLECGLPLLCVCVHVHVCVCTYMYVCVMISHVISLADIPVEELYPTFLNMAKNFMEGKEHPAISR